MRLTTTVIGSLPRLHEDLREAIRLAVDLQVETGIDIVSDGEQRTDMLSYLSNSMQGLKTNGEKISITGRIRPVENIEESFRVVDFLEARKRIAEKGYSNGLKIGISGPITFGFSAALRNPGPYGNVRNIELYNDVALVVNRVARLIQSYGCMIQFDEPGVSAGFLDPARILEPIEIATEGLEPRLTSIHVCGKLNLKTVRCLTMVRNVGVLSLEFAGSPGNIDLLSRSVLEDSAKRIGVGCVRVNVLSKDDLTTPESAVGVIGKTVSKIGFENVAYIHPDCGLRRTERDLAFLVLRNLVEASRMLDA
jgi:methionine synthase II (cobalamin-independent)